MLVRDKKKLIFTLVSLLAVSVSMEGVFAETEYKYPPAEEFDEPTAVDSLDNSFADNYPVPYPKQEPVTAPAQKKNNRVNNTGVNNARVSQALPRTSSPMPQPGAYGRARPPANPYARPMPQAGAYGRPMPPANPYARPMPQAGAYGRAMPPANPYARPMPQAGAYGRAMPPPGAYPPPGGSGAPGHFRPPPGGPGPGYASRGPNMGPGPYTGRGPNTGPNSSTSRGPNTGSGPYTSRGPNTGRGPYASRGPNAGRGPYGRPGSYGGPGPNSGSGSNMFPWGNQDWNIVDIMSDMPWVDNDGRVIPEFPWSREDNCHPKDKNCIKDTGPSSWIFDQGIKEDMAELWDDVTSAPGDMGQMPGGWYVPSVYTPNPIDSGDQIEEGIEIIPDIIRLYE